MKCCTRSILPFCDADNADIWDWHLGTCFTCSTNGMQNITSESSKTKTQVDWVYTYEICHSNFCSDLSFLLLHLRVQLLVSFFSNLRWASLAWHPWLDISKPAMQAEFPNCAARASAEAKRWRRSEAFCPLSIVSEGQCFFSNLTWKDLWTEFWSLHS